MKPAGSKVLEANRDRVRKRLRKIAVRLSIAIACLYIVGVVAGFCWLRYSRNVGAVRFLDVALLNAPAVHRSIAVEQFARARREWDAKNHQAAYVIFSSAIRHDPANVAGRLDAADFFWSIGAAALAQNVLSDGLAHAPGEPRLIKQTFGVLLRSGRDREVLRLLRELYPAGYSGANELDLQTYELYATLTSEGHEAAGRVLGRFPRLVSHTPAMPVLAGVAWESAEREKAVGILAEYVRDEAAGYADFLRLARWQQILRREGDAMNTAELACSRFPDELPPKILRIELLASSSPGGIPPAGALERFLEAEGRRPEAIARLATLAGNKGWVDLARMLYEIGVLQGHDLPHLALSFSDALMARRRFAETGPLLAGIEAQLPEDNVRLAVQLRQRQIVAASAVGDSNAVREYARRLGAAVGKNPEALEMCRRLFSRLGIADAVDELTPRAAKPATVADAG